MPGHLVYHIVKLSLGAMEGFLNGVVQDLAKTKVFARQVTGIVDHRFGDDGPLRGLWPGDP